MTTTAPCPICQRPVSVTIMLAGQTGTTRRFMVDAQHAEPVDPPCALALEASLIKSAETVVQSAPGSSATVVAPHVEPSQEH